MSSKAIAKQRLKFWLNDPRCFYCGVVTVFERVKGCSPDNFATIDHLRPRHHPDRLEPAVSGEVRRVLACFRCNNDRDKRELAALPKEWFYENGGNKPLSTKTNEELQAILLKIDWSIAESLRAKGGRRARRNRARHRQSLEAVKDEIAHRITTEAQVGT